MKIKSTEQEQEILTLRDDLDRKCKDLQKAEKDNDALRTDLIELCTRNKETIEAHDKMKREFVEIELRATKNSLDQIFKLTEIAFRNPAKLRTFDTPIPLEGGFYQNGTYINKNSDKVEKCQGSEKIEEI